MTLNCLTVRSLQFLRCYDLRFSYLKYFVHNIICLLRWFHEQSGIRSFLFLTQAITSHLGNRWWFPYYQIQAKIRQSGFPTFLSYLSVPSFLSELLIGSKLLLAEQSSKLQPGKLILETRTRSKEHQHTCLPWVKPSCPLPPVLCESQKARPRGRQAETKKGRKEGRDLGR